MRKNKWRKINSKKKREDSWKRGKNNEISTVIPSSHKPYTFKFW